MVATAASAQERMAVDEGEMMVVVTC